MSLLIKRTEKLYRSRAQHSIYICKAFYCSLTSLSESLSNLSNNVSASPMSTSMSSTLAVSDVSLLPPIPEDKTVSSMLLVPVVYRMAFVRLGVIISQIK